VLVSNSGSDTPSLMDLELDSRGAAVPGRPGSSRPRTSYRFGSYPKFPCDPKRSAGPGNTMINPTGDTDGGPGATIFIAYVPDHDLWHAVWSNQDGFVADHDAPTKAEILAWARQRCDAMWIWAPGQKDYLQVGNG